MATTLSAQTVLQAEGIPYVDADEAYSLMKQQFDCFMTLIESLDPQDWSQPTACTLWTVREIVAHQAGGYASGTGYREFFRQNLRIPKRGQLIEDAINELQVGERANRSPQELIDELRLVEPVAIKNWAFGFRVAKGLALPHPVAGILTLRYLMWVIHSRDTWMHRIDICRATGRKYEKTAGQDSRMTALVMRDTANTLRRKLGPISMVFALSGFAGGRWKIGAGEPSATVEMDAIDFSIFASGRYSYEEARVRANITGDMALAEKALRNLLILF